MTTGGGNMVPAQTAAAATYLPTGTGRLAVRALFGTYLPGQNLGIAAPLNTTPLAPHQVWCLGRLIAGKLKWWGTTDDNKISIPKLYMRSAIFGHWTTIPSLLCPVSPPSCAW